MQILYVLCTKYPLLYRDTTHQKQMLSIINFLINVASADEVVEPDPEEDGTILAINGNSYYFKSWYSHRHILLQWGTYMSRLGA